MISELVPHLYTEYSGHLKAQPSHVYAESFEMPEERPFTVSKRIDHFREQFSYTLKENGSIAFPKGHPLNNPLGRFEEKTPIRPVTALFLSSEHSNKISRLLFFQRKIPNLPETISGFEIDTKHNFKPSLS